MFDQFSPHNDDGFAAWRERLEALPNESASVRRALPTDQDGRWMRWVQFECPTLFVQSVTENVLKIKKQLVFLAEVGDCPVGLCIAAVGRYDPEHLFIQRVGVVPPARRLGAGIALLSAAAAADPIKNIAGATLDGDAPAQALNAKLAALLSADIHNVSRRRFAPTDLGVVRGEPHRPWLIDRLHRTSEAQ